MSGGIAVFGVTEAISQEETHWCRNYGGVNEVKKEMRQE